MAGTVLVTGGSRGIGAECVRAFSRAGYRVFFTYKNSVDAATALSNLGAAAASHNHSASNITSGTLNAARLPFKVKYGTATIAASWTSVSLSGFSSTPMILCTYTDDATSSGINVIKTRNRSASSFEVCTAGSSATYRTICWLAIGT